MSHRRHSRDDRSHRKRKRSITPPPPLKSTNPYDCRHDLTNYLEDNFNIRKQDDFWTFYTKYESLQRLKKATDVLDRRKLFNFRFSISDDVLYEKLPMYTRRGERMCITKDKFRILSEAAMSYQDFQQKSRFGKLKALRNTQRDLPIAQFRDEIVKNVMENSVVLIAGDTGCGKSTQVPQYILEAGFKKIACTQPRRIACVSLAKRVSHETLATYKNQIGYQIRFEKSKNRETNVIFLTEGILLRQASDADVLTSYDAIILDEVHERHLNMDFLVGIMKCLLQQRKFKLILMSATINLGLFESYFESENVKTVKVPGRLYPIDLIYKPIVKDAYDKRSSRFDCQPYLNVLEMIDAKYKPNEKGDALIFLNGFNEISSLASAVEEYSKIKMNWVVLQLHSTLSLEEQDRVFHAAPEGVRKCIISTNIAETSVTIDGVRFVIDSGKVNRMMYENCGVNRLFETTISQDSAKQRSGRAGRTGPGICYRLYSEEEFSKFEPFTPAEIHLVPLENLVLSMITLGLQDVEQFPFLEKPSEESLRNSLTRLSYLEALKSNEGGALFLTPLGNAMSKLPVDLSVSKMLITSTIFGTVNFALALASLISVQSPLIETKYFETREHRTEYESNHGEPITLLNLYKAWLEVKLDAGYNKKNENSRSWSRKRGIEEQRFYEATKLIEQFRDILQDAELIPKLDEANLNSRERSMRNGELKQLRKMRKDLKYANKDTRQQKLKMNNDDDIGGDDLRDVEFRITNDFRKISRMLEETRTDSYKDLMLLKLLLTGALYPQIAIEDEFNSSKTVNERLFHTKMKNYVFLRPTSYFNENPDSLQLDDAQIDSPPSGFSSKRQLSKNHQILIYQKLLETRKTYLMNTFRMPALQTLLLFAKTINTNRTLTRLTFDDFIQIDLPYLWQGKFLLLKAIDLRKALSTQLNNKLNDNTVANNTDLIYDLIDFTRIEASYTIKRLLPADLKLLYNFEDEPLPDNNPFDSNFPITKNHCSGYHVTENVIYSSLASEAYDFEAEHILTSKPYNCSNCTTEFLSLNFYDVLLHERNCQKEKNPIIVANVNQIKPNSKNYKCDKCGLELLLTPVEFLKHKKCCVPVKQERV